ncbi:hypothetical protein [Pyxidicoccus sp. MSG2]|uniref:hypothetical protein n=1 Tax=Pyxidicoccus sp. MSG2 TaxID=2996790 RepID=UPI002270673E|nr:hypothetical protein [Pyxidicoccus sp. MSG2]MCY1014530.1 hypothetical protein [Pyxidicoccus sp. MSG2]
MTTTNSAIVPVSPNLINNNQGQGIIASLAGLAPMSQVLVDLPAPQLPQNAPVRLVSQFASASAVIDAGFGGVVKFNADASATYVLGDIRAIVQRPGRTGGIILSETWGISYRFTLKAWKLKTTTNMTLATIAADCTVSGSGSAFQASVIGIDAAALLREVPGLTTVMGPFDMDKYQELGMVQTQLGEYIQDNVAALRPQLLEVEVDLSKVTAPYANSPSTLLGMSGVQNGKTEQQAWAKRPTPDKLPAGMSVDEALVKDMYYALGVDDSQPTSSQKAAAAKSTFRGE